MALSRSASVRAHLLLLLVLGFALSVANIHAQVFKWVDEKGRTHYGEKPPEGVKSTEVGVPAPGPATPAAPAAGAVPDWKAKELEMQRRRVDREQQARKEEGDAAARERRCADARRKLGVLEAKVPLYDFNEKGERVFLEDRDRPAAIAAQQKRVDDNCR